MAIDFDALDLVEGAVTCTPLRSRTVAEIEDLESSREPCLLAAEEGGL